MTNTPVTKHVFMSYSRRDESTMQRIVNFLRKRGTRVWVDNEKLVPGTPIWEVEIEKAIVSAGALIILLSPDSKNSPWVRREISYAEENDIRIFPLLITGNERTSIPIRLTNHQRIDVRQNEEMGLNSLSTALLFHLEDLAAREQRAEREAAEKAAREKAEREAAERAAREKAEREAAEKAAREKAEREAAEKAAKEKARRDAAEKAAREKAEREAAEKAAKEKARRDAAEKAAREKAEREAARKGVREKARREAAEKAMKQKAGKIISQQDPFLNEMKPPSPNSIPEESMLQQKPGDLPA